MNTIARVVMTSALILTINHLFEARDSGSKELVARQLLTGFGVAAISLL